MRFVALSLVLALTVGASSARAGSGHLLGLRDPVDVVNCGMCLDGGSVKGTLKDADGVEYHFFIDQSFMTKSRGRWYVGADFNSGRAEAIGHGDWRKNAIRLIVLEWLDRVASPEEQERLRSREKPDYLPYASSRDQEFAATTWYLANIKEAMF